jgi:hypothetical protein
MCGWMEERRKLEYAPYRLMDPNYIFTPPYTILDMLELLYKPQNDISYSFILYCYLICSALCLVLLGFEYTSYSSAVHGYWIVFAPFLPCVVWAFLMKRQSDANKVKIE